MYLSGIQTMRRQSLFINPPKRQRLLRGEESLELMMTVNYNEFAVNYKNQRVFKLIF